jgi:hypothetical protein
MDNCILLYIDMIEDYIAIKTESWYIPQHGGVLKICYYLKRHNSIFHMIQWH